MLNIHAHLNRRSYKKQKRFVPHPEDLYICTRGCVKIDIPYHSVTPLVEGAHYA